jgi:hypothetical protein
MVPSDLWLACSPTGMHGQNVASGNGVTLALYSPVPALASLGSKRRCASANPLPVEARFSMRPFTLRRRKLAFRPVPAAKSMFPAYIFKTIRETFTRPVRSHAPAPVWPFIASRDAFTARNPLLSSASRFSVCLRAAAPPQDLSIPRVRSTQLDSNRRSLPLRVARSSFAPHSAKILSRRETDHRSRSATSRQARYPTNLLEPSSSCTQRRWRSI